MNKLTWITRGVTLPDVDFDRMVRWIKRVAEEHQRILGPITYIFTDDPEILKVNLEFLQHDYFTDIITFDYTCGRMIRGDIFISLDTVRTNAEAVGTTYRDELHRVIIHGILHLCGINDKGPGEREIMEMHENNALKSLSDNDF